MDQGSLVSPNPLKESYGFKGLFLIQGNSFHNPSCLFCQNCQVDPKIHMEIQGTQNSQKKKKDLGKGEHSRKTDTSQFQNQLQSCSNQDSVVLSKNKYTD